MPIRPENKCRYPKNWKEIRLQILQRAHDCCEFAETLAWFLQNGYRVKIDRLGAFKVGLRSKGAITPTEFKESENIKSTHINFTPDREYDSKNRSFTATAMRGVSFANITTMGSDAEMTKRKESMAGGSTPQP